MHVREPVSRVWVVFDAWKVEFWKFRPWNIDFSEFGCGYVQFGVVLLAMELGHSELICGSDRYRGRNNYVDNAILKMKELYGF
jgi:hypothetical protein